MRSTHLAFFALIACSVSASAIAIASPSRPYSPDLFGRDSLTFDDEDTTLEDESDYSSSSSYFRQREERPYAPELYVRSSLDYEKDWERRSASSPSSAEEEIQQRDVSSSLLSWPLDLVKRGDKKSSSVKLAQGSKCNGVDSACQDGLFCSISTDTCKAKGLENESCRFDSGCSEKMSCVNRLCRKDSVEVKATKSVKRDVDQDQHKPKPKPSPSGHWKAKRALVHDMVKRKPMPSGAPWEQRTLYQGPELQARSMPSSDAMDKRELHQESA